MRSIWSALLLTIALGAELPAQVRTFQLAGTADSHQRRDRQFVFSVGRATSFPMSSPSR